MKPRTKFPNTIVPFIAHFLDPYKPYVLGFIACALISGFYGIVNATLTKTIINLLEGSDNFTNLWPLIFWPAFFLVINFEIHNLTWRIISFINYKIQPIIKNNIILETSTYVYRHSHQFFQDNLAGKISNNTTILADNMERALNETSPHIIRGIVLLGGALATTYFVHPLFFYGLITWTVCFCTISYLISRNIVSLAEDHAKSESFVSGQLVDSISNAQNIRLFAQYAYEASYILKALTVMKQKFQKKELFLINFHLLQGFSLTLMLAFMLYTLINLRMQGLVTTGDYALILGLSIEVGFTLWWVTEQVDQFNNAIGKCNQSLKALLEPLEITDKEDAHSLLVHEGQIVFDNVKFHYKGAEPLFENKSVRILPDQKVGLVGYSGSGKTTFVNLILRLFDVTGGRILIDGQDIRDVTQDSLRSQIGMIPQDPSLFHRTIMENIRYGKLNAEDAEVIDAAKKAHAHDFIIKLPQGYESLTGERGVKLSGGQRQRIAIARAILKNAPFLILDEATSQLDSVTESMIQESILHLMQGKTTIVVAHRLSTLLHMNRILVFDKGKIVEDGVHQDLIAKGGLYKTLWEAQVGGFLADSGIREEA